ncbi:hypothetical protein F5Y14DRAFT_404658 [Nemania sp. NC0429]|nr:hypothetical protein F5Y14DRAFT_404658 [Nemania sp. NC0429]
MSKPEAEVRVGERHLLGPHAVPSQVIESPPTLTFEPPEASFSKHTARLPTKPSSVRTSSPSSYRQHQRQQSAPILPARRPSTPSLPPSRAHSPKRSQAMPLTGDRRGGNSPGRFGGRLSGRSTPPVDHDTAFPSNHGRAPVDTTPKSAAPSRLGFLASFTSRMASPTQSPARTDDELCDLDVEAALFPASTPLDGEAFSPAAYKNLQANATGLLHRMQDAYRQRTTALREMQAEREAYDEEMEEMELRARHFKSQLETMAAKAAEQEKAMQQLVAELQAERRAHRHHEEREQQRARLFRGTSGEDGGSVVGNEDLCVDEDERKRWRASNSTLKSDISIDTDGDSAESESIFSRSRSPTAMTCVTENESLMDVPVPVSATPSLHLSPGSGLGLSLGPHHPPTRAAAAPKPKSAQQLTAFQRLVKGISAIKEEGETPGSGSRSGSRPRPDTCRNCGGQDSSVAWNTVSLLRDENSALKQRVAHLEVAVEGALDVVNGIKI